MAYPTLNANEIYSSLSNMIISQQVFDRIAEGDELVDKARVDGSLFGDTKLFYSVDALESHPWGNDAEAANLLALDRPADPETQAIVIELFRQIRLTLDDYLSKRAWSDEGAFGQFNVVMEGMLSKTKRIYDVCTYNAAFGTTVATLGKQSPTALTLTSGSEGKEIAEAIANILDEMADFSRNYNDYAQVTKFSRSEIKIVWNSRWVNKIKKLEMPVTFHDGFMDKFDNVLHEKYFGAINAAQTEGNGTTVRSLVEQTIAGVHYFPGELIKSGDNAPAGTSYTCDPKIICKIVVKYIPYMSAFSAGTTFFNPRSLTTNRYLTFGTNDVKKSRLKGYPFVTVKAA